MHGRRRADERSCCITWGRKASTFFYTLPDKDTTFDEEMTALQKHFVPKVNVVACRYIFRQRVQRADETLHCCFKSVSGSMCVRANGG